MRHHPKEALQLLSKGSQFPESVLSESLKGFDWSLAPKEQDIQAMKDIKDFLLQQHILRRDFDIQELFDGSYLSRVKGLSP
jgi:ABC-type nitrate/sulfonate/bicarbonate transport system substrate-binding protein